MSVVGAWLVNYGRGETPRPLARDQINPLSADAVAVFTTDGLVTVSVSPVYPVPAGAISATQLLLGTAAGGWADRGDGRIAVRCAAVLRREQGSRVATLVLDATIEVDSSADTFSGPYTIDSHLTRAWSRNLPSLDGAVQGWRIEPPAA